MKTIEDPNRGTTHRRSPIGAWSYWLGASVLLCSLAGVLTLHLAGCPSSDDDDSSGDDDTTDDAFECTEDRAGWEQCDDGAVQWCHVIDGYDPHFHWGMDCAAEGYDCVEHGDHEADCVDPTTTCAAGDFQCDDNTAMNCLDGHFSIEDCGTGECHEHGDEAECEESSSEFDPQQACDLFDSETPENKAVTTTFGDVFDGAYHADLDVPVYVTLPEQQASYIHFPVEVSGEYVVFLNTAGVFDKILDSDEVEQATSGGVANGECPEVLVDHYHGLLEYDGDGTGPVPFVIGFQAVAAQEVGFIVMLKAAAE